MPVENMKVAMAASFRAGRTYVTVGWKGGSPSNKRRDAERGSADALSRHPHAWSADFVAESAGAPTAIVDLSGQRAPAQRRERREIAAESVGQTVEHGRGAEESRGHLEERAERRIRQG